MNWRAETLIYDERAAWSDAPQDGQGEGGQGYECTENLFKNGTDLSYHRTLADQITNVVCPKCGAFFDQDIYGGLFPGDIVNGFLASVSAA